MQKSSEVVARVIDGDRLECRVTSPSGQRLVLSGDIADANPTFDEAGLGANRVLVSTAWAFARARQEAVSLPEQELQRNAEKRAESLRKEAEWIAVVSDELTDEEKQGWCSACFGEHPHRKAKLSVGQTPAFVCVECGTPTLPCAGIGCNNMAVRGRGAVQVPRYCAEHRHEIPGFDKADRKIGDLGDYKHFLKYDKPNLARATKIAGFTSMGLVAGGPLAYLGAAAIGGAVGSLLGGFSGAAATSYGLALLGGGAVAAGGLGMAGGTLVVTACGAALGGALGASVMNAYVRQDKSFHIEMLQGGSGVPVIVCNGFLSETGKGWGEWRELVTKRYPDSPVYRVHWGAKELKHLTVLGGEGAVKLLGIAALKESAAKAAKLAAKKLGPLAPALLAVDLAKNPWHVAKNRAEKTGAIVADLLARTTTDSYVLIGHSLGARAMTVAAQTLAGKATAPRVQALHLLGAAIGAKSDWCNLASVVDGTVYNYHSANDAVLKFAYGVAQAEAAAGLGGFKSSSDKVRNVDVSSHVKNHFEYLKKVDLS
ncbi:hypothetical protein BIU82_14205 [Arthrobacter sp. SW1]|uniref:DUF726 domain-containing protein n=1 Tax=Arthrobacter sp. SW1 TaxID=1920889 RepID=UPI000877D857|nr:DUF726 domain-containing protein [Arthrobacter sp. SW1]OFI39473.1 hypothetical protein BIU82_14205 [Arthrobacter sp. SW1]